jgi:thiamine-monophosphate kinase
MNEFDLINKYLKPLSPIKSGSFNLSDDIFFDKKYKIAISVDTYVEGTHFINAKNPDKFLKKILRASLSDLYCKGVKPNYYLLSFALNKKFVNNSWLLKVKKILISEQKKFNILLVGGDTTTSSKLVVTVTVLGYAYNNPVLRNGSKINDDIYVTGNISDSYVGLNIIKKRMNLHNYNQYFVKKYYEPILSTKVSAYLSKIASSSIDISDGLVQDLSHICKSSKCGAKIFLQHLPFSKNCKLLIKRNKLSILKIFSNGDDYQIMFTSNKKNRSKIKEISKRTNSKITRIGIIKKKRGILIENNFKKVTLNKEKMGYTHIF